MRSLQQTFDFDLAVHPASVTTIAGGNATFIVEVRTKAGVPELVTLLTTGFPQDWNASFFPESGLPQPLLTSTLTIETSLSTPVGTYSMTIQATSKALVRTATATLTLVAPPSDFELSLSPETRSVVQGESTMYIVTVTVIGAFSQPVVLKAVGLPVGAIGRLDPRTFRPKPGEVAQASTLYVTTNSTAMPGEYTISVVGTSGTATRTAMSKLVVLYSDPFSRTWQIFSNLPDTVKGGTIGGAAIIIAAIVTAYASRRKRQAQTDDEET
jgi:uncharacterized membrane protein